VHDKDNNSLETIAKNLLDVVKNRLLELKKQKDDKINEALKCLEKLEELGVVKGTKEYNVALRVFKSRYNRKMFTRCVTPKEKREYL